MKWLLIIPFFLIIFSKNVFSSPIYKGPLVLYRPSAVTVPHKGFEWETGGTYFYTTGYFDKHGKESDMPNRSNFTKTEGILNLKYGLIGKMEINGGGRYRENQSKYSSGDSHISRGFESYWGGLKYSLLPQRRWIYALSFKFMHTTYGSRNSIDTNSRVDEETVLGDAGSGFTIGFHMSHLFKSLNYFSGSISYNKPPSDLSSELVYNAEGVLMKKNWAFLLGIDGIHSLETDEYSNPEYRITPSTGLTNLYNGVNREKLAPYLGFNIGFSSWRLRFKFSQVLMGKSTDEGYEAGFHIAWNSKGKQVKSTKDLRYKEYPVEAVVTKLSSSAKYLRLNKGLTSEIFKGMRIDLFKTDYHISNILVASGVVYEAGTDWAIVKIVKRYNKMPLEVGLTARGSALVRW